MRLREVRASALIGDKLKHVPRCYQINLAASWTSRFSMEVPVIFPKLAVPKVALGLLNSGEFVTLRDLRKEVGNDAARLFYVMRSNDQHLDFDLELAKSRSNDNPVYYIQYAHARVASVLRQLADRGLGFTTAATAPELAGLRQPQEITLIKRLTQYPEIIEQCAAQRAPHTLVHYLRDLAHDFHTNYSAHQLIVADDALRNARLSLAVAAQGVIRNGLKLLGVSAPDTM